MKRAWMVGVVAVLAGVVGMGALYGRDYLDGMHYEKAMNEIDRTGVADGGPWPQPQETCFFCHGARGQSVNAWYPALSGQPEAYLIAQLHAFAGGQRPDPYMGAIARELTDEQIKSLAAYFARQTPAQSEAVRAGTALEKRGMALVAAKSCQACHGASFMGADQVPRLAGQGEAYLAKQLAAFQTGERHDPSGAMNGMAATLSGEDIQAVAGYLASLTPGGISAGTQ
ncbi:cytochrome c4 [Paraburkholderia fungorum]|uniref:c-type cytochrome n=1 Tax=Paraburkholderia fungorum TaxID=134537 RepID=UPI000489F5E0|nr:c-type cytochrome [Paraburkholderia fungorum]MBB5539768.1 cytochrome c553 [Paraburkholderia fungorum]PNE53207.1 cytochrome c4 [Paraburkholderia fungorum]